MEKNGKTKNIVLAVLLVAVVTLSIAYAVLSATLTINAQATVKGSTWDVKFVEKEGQSPLCVVTKGSTSSDAALVQDHEGTVTATTFEDLQVNFRVPGDKVVCTWQVKNNGSINAKLSHYNPVTVSLSGTEASKLQGKILTTLTVDGDTPSTNRPLAASAAEDVVLTIEFDHNADATNLPSSDVVATISSETFTYEQN